MKIWKMEYMPFSMGGRSHRPVCCEVEPTSEKIDLGRGYFGYIVTSTTGETYVVESETGGIVGKTVADVMRDIASADEHIMRMQIEDAKGLVALAQPLDATAFWHKT